ncbi:dihydrofolate reductase [Methylibium petroleiphilum]|uniref:dihydrofolate reductase n=1 Tax=Methylibium petroleiphilum (strain ATCC BAA-1232 / LMG 22953 / PM1) TaxID=420662 RepID=A2SN57_METPP|nr:dihydrofolate reductase [Methylibium petroleiphilum]ABM96996.1 dihydrofolate reductase [Methylibium petroleiphilum PM1]
MDLAIIAACARNGVIGRNNDLPWRLPEDLAHFRSTTGGWPVIMGRLTWESLPARFRPLPGRRNIIVSRGGVRGVPKGVDVVASLEAALELVQAERRAFVIGGARLYEAALPLADELFLTEIDEDFEGDVYFPEFDRSAFVEHHRMRRQAEAPNTFTYSFAHYRRKLPARSGPLLEVEMTPAQCKETVLHYQSSGLLLDIRIEARGKRLIGVAAGMSELIKVIEADYDHEYGLTETPAPTRSAMLRLARRIRAAVPRTRS